MQDRNLRYCLHLSNGDWECGEIFETI